METGREILNIREIEHLILEGREVIEVLAGSGNARIERIVSNGQASPPGFWYDQDEDEWVMLISGEARIAFENGPTRSLHSGDYLLIKAHEKHRVEYVSTEPNSIWLAVFF